MKTTHTPKASAKTTHTPEEMAKTNYTPKDIANLFGLHSNTIRLYERLGYISRPKRGGNNYRQYTHLHVLQVKVCRCILGYPFTNRRIRDAGNLVMSASAQKQWEWGKQQAYHYLQTILQEYSLAQKTADILQSWANPESHPKLPAHNENLTRKKVAAAFGITAETVRNWERNHLIVPDKKGPAGEVLYSAADLDRLKVIYMLRSAGYSMAAIHKSLSMYDKGHSDQILTVLHDPKPDDLISVGDRWLYELAKLMDAAREIPPIFCEMETL